MDGDGFKKGGKTQSDAMRGYLLESCALGAAGLELEDGLVGHLDGCMVQASLPREGGMGKSYLCFQ